MNAALWIISVIAILIILEMYNRKEERRHKEAIRRSDEMKNSIDDFTHAIEKLEITEEQFDSMRRWMRGTMNELKHHGEKLEAYKKSEEPEQMTISELVKDMMEGEER